MALLKGTVDVISSDPPFEELHVPFTTVPFKPDENPLNCYLYWCNESGQHGKPISTATFEDKKWSKNLDDAACTPPLLHNSNFSDYLSILKDQIKVSRVPLWILHRGHLKLRLLSLWDTLYLFNSILVEHIKCYKIHLYSIKKNKMGLKHI